jgi:hypothetical protein
MTYAYNGWTFIANEDLTHLGAIETKIDAFGNAPPVYLFRAPVGTTKLLAYATKEAAFNGDYESLDALYSLSTDALQGDVDQSAESIPAINLSYFEHVFGTCDLDRVIDYLETKELNFHKKKKLTLLGLGDVGSMLSIGLKLLGGACIESLGLYDISEAQKSRWEMELNQIAINPSLKITKIERDDLFSGDMFIFCASKGVPKVGEEGKDVRMIQFEENAKLIAQYAEQARDEQFKGIFAVVSDPVDLLCKQVFESSNRNERTGKMDYVGLLPEQVIGFGLGVMDGRAQYYSDQMSLNYTDKGRVFGPHGEALVVADDVLSEDQGAAMRLTKCVVEANLEMRALGYKPFVAPAMSSGAVSITKLLAGKDHYSANFLRGVYWGGKNKQNCYGVEYERLTVSKALKVRIESTYKRLEDTWKELNA